MYKLFHCIWRYAGKKEKSWHVSLDPQIHMECDPDKPWYWPWFPPTNEIAAGRARTCWRPLFVAQFGCCGCPSATLYCIFPMCSTLLKHIQIWNPYQTYSTKDFTMQIGHSIYSLDCLDSPLTHQFQPCTLYLPCFIRHVPRHSVEQKDGAARGKSFHFAKFHTCTKSRCCGKSPAGLWWKMMRVSREWWVLVGMT